MRYILIAILLFLTSGCYDGRKKEYKETLELYTVCKDSEKMCETLVADSVCRSLRREVIIGNYAANNVDDINLKEKYQYELLVNLENYVDCSEKSTFIEYDYKKHERADKEQNRNTQLTADEIEERKKFKENLKERESKRD